MSKRIVYALPMPGGKDAPAAAVADDGSRRFEKELIREGTWVHPTRRFTFRVTPKRMRGWVGAFRRMREAGLKVPLPFGHSADPRDNAGFLEDLRVEGNRLVGVLAVPRNEDAERLGTTVRDVSVSINPDFVDAHGTRFGEVIEHVALTTCPVVEGQANFAPVEQIAASVDGAETEVWTFAAQVVKDHKPDVPENLTRIIEEEERPTSNVEHPTSNNEEEGARLAAESAPAPDPSPADAARASTEPTGPADGYPSPPESPDAEVAALRLQLAREREARIAAEVAGHVAAGRIVPAAAAVARLLLNCEPAARFDLDAQQGDALDVAGTVRQFLSLLPAGAALDLDDRTRHLRPMPNAGNSAVATGRAAAAAARRMLESRGYAVTLSADGTTVLEAVKA